MINKIWNWIKELITPHRQDEHLEFYEGVNQNHNIVINIIDIEKIV